MLNMFILIKVKHLKHCFGISTNTQVSYWLQFWKFSSETETWFLKWQTFPSHPYTTYNTWCYKRTLINKINWESSCSTYDWTKTVKVNYFNQPKFTRVTVYLLDYWISNELKNCLTSLRHTLNCFSTCEIYGDQIHKTTNTDMVIF